ncbi:helix-turn-helix domain-containing protein [Brevundimonas sp.]|jgi:transcriptional regulator with XRE-family HTH domain|uniref:helix-turn-helix domain-containing protein n=1 Tax=Brevundimonas sp. TaxID=1871086 RepID=UPI003565D0D7
MDWKDTLGQNILRCRTDRGWTQQDLASEADLSVRFVSGIERGEENPSLETTFQIAVALDVPIWILLKPKAD